MPYEPPAARRSWPAIVITRRCRPIIALALACAVTLMSGVAAALTTGQTPATTGKAAMPGSAGSAGSPNAPVTNTTDGRGPGFRRAVPPDLLAVATRPVGELNARRIGRLARVREVLILDGGAVKLQGRKVNVFAVDPFRFRSWTPPGTAKREELWTALAANRFVMSNSTAKSLGLRTGLNYPITASSVPVVTMGGSGSLGLPSVDMLVSRQTGAQMGLVPDLVVLVNAPHGNLRMLSRQLRKILGDGTQILNLHNQPAARQVTSYLDLYRQAATTCPGLSWTVLAAIGQIESAHGRNAGRSSAGALGPMQFMPATWRAYGVDGDGDRRADIMNPFDAVPTAARYLCANGAGRGGRSLYNAIFRYNHADWYVRAVLRLAAAYAGRYS